MKSDSAVQDWSTTEAPEERRVTALLSGLCLLSAMAVPASQLSEVLSLVRVV